MKLKVLSKLMLGVMVAFGSSCASQSSKQKDNTPWVYLINKNNTEGWTILGGEATYKVEKGVVTGTTVANTPNTFLVTKKLYNDFIFEIDFKVDSTMNSGIQIRSNSLPFYQNGRVHGYQVEIDPSKRAWSGGIYDEGRRKWLTTLENNSEAQKAFKQNQWNHYRVEAIGSTIKTWINGVPASYLIDDKTASGFIGLQVHSIGDKMEKLGKKVMWKDAKILTQNLSKYLLESPLEPVVTHNNLTVQEKKDGWEMLWDGKTTNGWRGAKLEHFPKSGWNIENGVLSVADTGGRESVAGGDIVTTKDYSNFELQVNFKITSGANSGIKYYVNTDINKGEGSSIGLEYQILDDEHHEDAKLGSKEGSRTMCSLYDLIKADANKPVNPVGEWNSARIVSINNHVEHWINDVKVLEYERGSRAFLKLVSESKYAKWLNFGLLEKGQILLQDHGNKVSFKNIKIRVPKNKKD
ncbi:3-keto-disaccharide hydrolase [Flavobacterium faecale]|uniref:3-keto-disaccharide hydrolase n=1 Tax=Flavobacterium faecale TaxID=1355330 RepID=UPI003AB0CC91